MWRGREERFQDANTAEHDRYGGGSIMVWAGVSRGGRTYSHIVVNGMMTGLCYRDDILEAYVRPYAGAIGPSSSLWTTTLDLIVPGWLRCTSNRGPWSVWTGQHAHPISTPSSMFGKCYRRRFCDVQSNRCLSWNFKMYQLKNGTILRWQPSRD